jgi:hypothetical protein
LIVAIVAAAGGASPTAGERPAPAASHDSRRATVHAAGDEGAPAAPALTLPCSLSRTRSTTRTRAAVPMYGRPMVGALSGQPGSALAAPARLAELAPTARLRPLSPSAPRCSRGPPRA